MAVIDTLPSTIAREARFLEEDGHTYVAAVMRALAAERDAAVAQAATLAADLERQQTDAEQIQAQYHAWNSAIREIASQLHGISLTPSRSR